MNYQPLKAGDVREHDDEQRTKERGPECGFYPNTGNSPDGHRAKPSPMQGPGTWEKVWLAGHVILASDLMHLDFRRPVK